MTVDDETAGSSAPGVGSTGTVAKKVLVTGAAGFIGSHLCARLLIEGWSVVGLDNLNDYYEPKIKQQNIRQLLSQSSSTSAGSFQFLQSDIRTHIFDCTLPESDFDLIIHLAAQAGVRYSIENPKDCFDININGTVNILEFARLKNTPILIASSSSVYGATSIPPFCEDEKCDKPVSPYAASKRSVELISESYHKCYQLPIGLLRFFTVYGPGGRPDMAVWKFTQSLLNGEEISRFGNGEQIREFTFIDDIIDGVMKSVDVILKRREFFIVNLGGGVTYTVNDVIRNLEIVTQKTAVVKELPTQNGDVPMTCACQKKAKEILGFEPKVSLIDGLKEFVRWFKEYHQLT